MIRAISLALFLACAAPPAGAEPPRSIVGFWQSGGQPCWPSAGAVRIDALAMAIGEEIYCEFDGATRTGATVAWTGRCEIVENRMDESRPFAETVVATERAGRLSIRFRRNGLVMADLRRCRP